MAEQIPNFRGHLCYIDSNRDWRYIDNDQKAGFGHEMRPCAKCGIMFEGSNIGEPDPCLGNLPGVDNACCGHGIPSESYVRFTSGVVLRGFNEIEYTERWEI